VKRGSRETISLIYYYQKLLFWYVCECEYVCVCVCVREREREREREGKEGGRERKRLDLVVHTAPVLLTQQKAVVRNGGICILIPTQLVPGLQLGTWFWGSAACW
jgi:hypothetical protein